MIQKRNNIKIRFLLLKLFTLVTLISSAQGKEFTNPCSKKPSISKLSIVVVKKDNSFQFNILPDTTWLYQYDSLKKRAVRTSEILSVNGSTIDNKMYKLFKIGEYLYIRIKKNKKVVYFDSLVSLNLNRVIQGYSFSSTDYYSRDGLNYLDSNAKNSNTYRNFLNAYYLVCVSFPNSSKFNRYFFRKRDFVLEKVEVCFTAFPFCPLTEIICKNCR